MQIKSGTERLSWIAGIASTVIAAVALGYSFLPSTSEHKPPSVSLSGNGSGNQIGTVAGNVTITSPPAEPQRVAKLPLVFKTGIIGSDVGWFESQVGLPVSRDASPGLRTYNIDGCIVDLIVRTDSTIDEATLHLSPICSFNWRDLNPNYADLPPPNKLHFADIFNSNKNWTLFVSCLSDCGNAADPYAELRTGGAHADDWLIIAFGSSTAGDNVAPLSALETKIENEKGHDFVVDGYQCGYDLNGAAAGLIGAMSVDYITIRPWNVGEEAYPGENERCKTAPSP
jgi:hypothetical protein